MPSLTPYAPLVISLSCVTGLVVWIAGGRTRRAGVAALLVVAWGAVIATTLTASPYQMYDPKVTCQFQITIGEVPRERLANVLLFVPLGFASWLAAPRWLWLCLALAAPFFIEGAQALVLALNRGCDATDVLANLAGLAIGAVVATAFNDGARRRRARAKPSPSETPPE